MRFTRFFVAGLISIAVIGSAVLFLWSAGPSNGGRTQFSTLSSAPRDVEFFMAINTDPASSQWLALSKKLVLLRGDEKIRDGLSQVLREEGLSWDKDIVAVLGDEGYVAVTDSSKIGEQRGVVAALKLRNARKAQVNFLKILRSSAKSGGGQVLEENYRGVTISYVQKNAGSGRPRSPREGGAIAFAGDEAVIGLSRDDVKGVVDVIQGRAPSLAQNSRFEEVRARQKDDFLIWGYVDLASAWDRLEKSAGALTGPTSASAFRETIDGSDRLIFDLSAQGNGFAFDAQVLRRPGSAAAPAHQSRPFDPALAHQVSADTIFLAAGANAYEQLFSPLQTAAAKDPTFTDMFTHIEADLGFRLDPDLFSLMKGEYALAANYSDEGPVPNFSVLGLMNIQDGVRVARSLDQLDRYLSREAGLLVRPADGNGVRRVGDSGFDLAWKASDKILVAGHPDDVVQSFAGPPAGKSLADTRDWKQAMAALPAEKSFVGYVSVARVLAEARGAAGLGTSFPGPDGVNFGVDSLKPVRALAMAQSSVSDGQRLRIVLLTDQ